MIRRNVAEEPRSKQTFPLLDRRRQLEQVPEHLLRLDPGQCRTGTEMRSVTEPEVLPAPPLDDVAQQPDDSVESVGVDDDELVAGWVDMVMSMLTSRT